MASSVHSLSGNSEADEQQKQTESHYQTLSPADGMPHPSIYGAHAQLGVGNVSGSNSKWDLIPRPRQIHARPPGNSEELPDKEEEMLAYIVFETCFSEIFSLEVDENTKFADPKLVFGEEIQAESFDPFDLDMGDFPVPCWVCDGPHTGYVCPLLEYCPLDQKVGEDYKVICLCGDDVINGRCSRRGCVAPYGSAVKKVLPKSRKRQKWF